MTFYFAYAGNKRKELEEINKYVDLTRYDTIIEPFGGTCSLSRYLYEKDRTKKYLISDNNIHLINFCNNFRKDSDTIINDTLAKMETITTKDEYNTYIRSNDKDDLIYYLIRATWYSLRPGLYSERRPKYKDLKKNSVNINEFFENNEYLYKDYKEQLELYKNDERSLIFLDPPYIVSCNDLYDCPTIDWEYLYNWTKSCKCKFIIIVNDNIFMQLLFKEFMKESNIKTYQMTKKKVKHNIYSNINL